MPSLNYDDVTRYPLDDADREEILRTQNEASFCWGTRDHWPMGVIMTYLWRDGKFWLTATNQRARIHAVKRDPRVTVIVSGLGTKVGAARSITAKGRCRVLDDEPTRAWVYPAIAAAILPDAEAFQARFVEMMDTERRVVLEVTPEKWITFDAGKMMRASMLASG